MTARDGRNWEEMMKEGGGWEALTAMLVKGFTIHCIVACYNICGPCRMAEDEHC